MALTKDNFFQINEFVKGEFSRADALSANQINQMLTVILSPDLGHGTEADNPFLGDESDFGTVLAAYNTPSSITVLQLQADQIDDAKMVFRLCILRQLFELIDAMPASAEKNALLAQANETKESLLSQTTELAIPPQFWDAKRIFFTQSVANATVAALFVALTIGLYITQPNPAAMSEKVSELLGGIRLTRNNGRLVGIVGCIIFGGLFQLVRYCTARPQQPVAATAARRVLERRRGTGAGAAAATRPHTD